MKGFAGFDPDQPSAEICKACGKYEQYLSDGVYICVNDRCHGTREHQIEMAWEDAESVYDVLAKMMSNASRLSIRTTTEIVNWLEKEGVLDYDTLKEIYCDE